MDLTAKPTIQKLLDYVKDLAPQWMDIGLKLMEKSEAQLSVIEANHPNIQKSCREMLQLWLRIDTDASWEQLIDVLKSSAIGLPVVAKNITQNQLSGMWFIVLTRKEMYRFYCTYIHNYVLM